MNMSFKKRIEYVIKKISTYHLYGIKYINGVYYEIKNKEAETLKK